MPRDHDVSVLPTSLQRIDARIADGESLIARQRLAIVRRAIRGMDIQEARTLLRVLCSVVENHKRVRERLIALETHRADSHF